MEMGAHHKNNGFHYYSDFTNVCIKVKQAEILIPNLFTPSEDGQAEGFEIKGLEHLADNNLYIVNQWGQEVYKSRNYKNEWTAEGLKDGNYYYLLMIQESSGAEWKAFKGYITLIRTIK
ncbi:MAG: gliding motility-associated C-terminal domain-containing protein [Pedobacter sp.]|nr:MAG: gliding motility-associated C-terminal domain-containing protein [Pedobacter sp.]